MVFVITFLEGVISFISPCLLPLLPVYISYFAGGERREDSFRRTVVNACGFVAGFSIIFLLLGAFAGFAGSLLIRYKTAVNIVTGAIVIIFGLNYLEVLRIPILSNTRVAGAPRQISGFFPAVLFGIVFSAGWTPCAGAFLGSALMLASSQASAARGVIMLFCYSMGLGLPFILSALLIDVLKTAFDAVKKHYRIINLVSGILLIAIGLLMMTGLMGRLIGLLT